VILWIQQDEGEVKLAARVEVNTPAPDIDMQDFQGKPFRLSNFRGKKRALLVFNRGFQ
jgi:peroxiredoxin